MGYEAGYVSQRGALFSVQGAYILRQGGISLDGGCSHLGLRSQRLGAVLTWGGGGYVSPWGVSFHHLFLSNTRN